MRRKVKDIEEAEDTSLVMPRRALRTRRPYRSAQAKEEAAGVLRRRAQEEAELERRKCPMRSNGDALSVASVMAGKW